MKTKNILTSYLKSYKSVSNWDTLRPARTADYLPAILEAVDGDILEIGAHRGDTTKVLCEIAAKFNRSVYVIDPWDGRQEGDAAIFNIFTANTNKYSNLKYHRAGSETSSAIEFMSDKKLSYLLVDGLHTYNAVCNDIYNYAKLIHQHGVLCVDDWTGPYGFSPEIQRATFDSIGDRFELIDCPPQLIERYFVRN
jgi:hypothetical protein